MAGDCSERTPPRRRRPDLLGPDLGGVACGYAPGRITFHRLQGAIVLYLNFATIFASAFSLISGLNPAGFAGLPAPIGDLGELATMMYFSLTTLTTTGYGDIVPVDPFARSLANLESVIGQFYLAITVARLVTLEVEDRRR
jgi:voltage-gated potassium channel Kch